jgi:hypothetical protein
VKLFVLLQREVRRRASWVVGAAVGGADSPTDISSASTRSVGARMNTSHIMSGCCWLPLMKPITRPAGCLLDHSIKTITHDVLELHPLTDDRCAAAAVKQRLLDARETAA